MKEIKDSYIAMTATKDIQEVCKPLTEFLGVDFLCYHKLFKDGKEIMLASDSNWVKHIHQNNLTSADDMQEPLRLKDFKVTLWPDNPKIKIIKDINELSSCYYGMSIALSHDEIFGFSIKNIKDIAIINTFLSNTEYFLRFCHYFKEKVGDLINTASKDMILYSHRKSAISANKQNDQINKFLAATQIKKYLYQQQELKFTEREIDCLKYFIKGYTASETAIALGISKRTVETHLENIRNKTGMMNKNDLIKFVFSNNIDKYL